MRHTRRRSGGGYHTSQQFFNPEVLPPHSGASALSTAPTEDAVRPVLHSTFRVGGGGVRRGGSYQTSQQFFNPEVLPPHSGAAALSTAPTEDAVRPVLHSTFRVGGGKKVRKLRGRKLSRKLTKLTRRRQGGFYPSVMGSFIANAQTAVLPATLMTAFQMNKSAPKSRRHTTKRHRRV